MSASLLFPLGRLLRRYEVGKRSAVTLHRPTHTGSSVLGLLLASLGGSRLISRPERPHVLRDRVELHHDGSDLRTHATLVATHPRAGGQPARDGGRDVVVGVPLERRLDKLLRRLRVEYANFRARIRYCAAYSEHRVNTTEE